MISILFSLLAKLYKYTLLYKNTRLLILLKSELFEDKAWVNTDYALLYFSSIQQTAVGPSEMPDGKKNRILIFQLLLFFFSVFFLFSLLLCLWVLFAPRFVLSLLFLILKCGLDRLTRFCPGICPVSQPIRWEQPVFTDAVNFCLQKGLPLNIMPGSLKHPILKAPLSHLLFVYHGDSSLVNTVYSGARRTLATWCSGENTSSYLHAPQRSGM